MNCQSREGAIAGTETGQMSATPYRIGRLAGLEALTVNYPYWSLTPVMSPYHKQLEEDRYRQWLAGVNDAVRDALLAERIQHHGLQ